MRHNKFIFTLLITLAFSTPAWAVSLLSVAVGNLDLTPRGTGFVEVTVAGDNDLLQACGFEFRIATTGPTRLQFVDPPFTYLNESSYLFYGNSFASANPPIGAVSESIVPGDTFIGGDMTLDMSDVTVPNSKLLARLQVTADTALPPAPGDFFTISLVPASSTYFTDSASHQVSFSATSGTVHVVPEPETIALLLIAAVFLALFTPTLFFHKSC
jgi:hypothetical protein